MPAPLRADDAKCLPFRDRWSSRHAARPTAPRPIADRRGGAAAFAPPAIVSRSVRAEHPAEYLFAQPARTRVTLDRRQITSATQRCGTSEEASPVAVSAITKGASERASGQPGQGVPKHRPALFPPLDHSATGFRAKRASGQPRGAASLKRQTGPRTTDLQYRGATACRTSRYRTFSSESHRADAQGGRNEHSKPERGERAAATLGAIPSTPAAPRRAPSRRRDPTSGREQCGRREL